jgi:hypothetical protein
VVPLLSRACKWFGCGCHECRVRVDVWVGMDEDEQCRAVSEDVVLCYPQLEIEDVQELPLDPANISFPKHASAQRPVHIFERRVVQVLSIHHVSSDTTASLRRGVPWTLP